MLTGQVSRPVLFAQAMAQAAELADLIVIAGREPGLTAKAAECGNVPAVAVPAMGLPGTGPTGVLGAFGALGALGVLGANPMRTAERGWRRSPRCSPPGRSPT